MTSTKQDSAILKIIKDNATFDVDEGVEVSPVVVPEIIEYIQRNLNPDDVFSGKDLESWAESNGFIKE